MKIKRKARRAETGCGRLPPLGGRLRFSGGLIALSATYPAAVVFAARSSR